MDVAPFQPVDRISNLPKNVLDNILMRLTLRDAAKTSILAKQWGHKWHNLPQIIFDKSLWRDSKTYEEARLKFVEILYQVLLRHQGPITKFSIDIPIFEVCSEIEHLIHILWKSNVQELTLKTINEEEYKLPSAIFRCLQLNHLSLSCCAINPPPSFKGFNRLIRLELEFVSIETGVLAKLMSSCPLLEELALLDAINQFDHLEIDAPMLKLFELRCDSASICFKKSPLLAKVSLSGPGGGFEIWLRNVVDFFNSVPGLQELDMESNFFYYVILPSSFKNLNEEVQRKIAAPFKNLKKLDLRTNLQYLDELSVVLFIISSCHNLEQLKIRVSEQLKIKKHVTCHYNEEEKINSMKTSLEAQDFSNVLFNHLQEVTLVNGNEFGGAFAELALAKFLLENSPVLKRMVILSSCGQFNVKLVETLTELNKFWRASPKAEVIYLNQDKL